MKKELVVKDNVLIEASYNLDLVEQRLILLAIIEARESGKGINAHDPLSIHAESYINQFGVHRNGAYQALKNASKDLFVRQFSYQEKRSKGLANVTSRWVSEIAYIEDAACVELIFAPAIIPLITRLEEHFTSYELEQVSKLNSGYAIRLYELIIAWRSTGKTPVINYDDLRKKLGVLDHEYKVKADFKKRVLDSSLKQVNEHTDIVVKYEQHKTGREITGFSFKFKQKPQPKNTDKKLPQRDPNTQDMFVSMTDAQRYMFGAKLARRIELNEYSSGTESYEEFGKRIAEMLLDETKFKTFYPLLIEEGFRA
ncbi:MULTISPECIES: replication initiation protein RepM [unclassified Acinetobacter]|uniref:replication initiation protein RepM n=1 Tax=unclassified Acinetobacter TaxID=196816 RepID=UPI0015D26619|nr:MULTISPECIES: replication initiation protein RepM [unclassified Acinetobacter]